MNLGPVIDFSDAMIFAMALVNIVGLYIMAPEMKRDLKAYIARFRSGDLVDTKEAS